ncbi:hypothetical protein [Alsobacter sp. R-9]
MDTYFGIILFSWIVIAPTIGLVVMSSMERRPRRLPSHVGPDYSVSQPDNRGTIASAQ